MTEAEYLAHEAASEVRHEFVNGEIFAMAGASPERELTVMNLGALLRSQLAQGPCKVFGSNLRVRIEETGLYAYPDLTVVCEQPRFADTNPRTLLNPRVVVEVPSTSTEGYDRTAKLAHYRRRPSIEEIALVSLAERRVEHYRRAESGGWLLIDASGEDAVHFPALQATLLLRDVFAGVTDLESAEVVPTS